MQEHEYEEPKTDEGTPSTIIHEQIPDDIPEWAIQSMAKGTLFKDMFERLAHLEGIVEENKLDRGFWP